jgi:heme exporter protein B
VTKFLTLLAKELRVEARSREMTTGALLLGLLVLVLGSLAWSDRMAPATLAPGLLWLALVFAGTLSLSRSLHRERDRGTCDLLALLPVDPGIVFLAKAAANLIVLLIVLALALPLFAALHDYDMATPLPRLGLVFLLGATGFSAAGTLLAAASAHGRARETLLPILLFPLLVPLLMMTLQGTQRVLEGASLADVAPELQVLLAFDIIYLAIGWLTFDRLLGD